jgi:hypothetical protein
MGPYIRRGTSLVWEEKTVKYWQEILELLDSVWALNGWQFYTAKGTKREIQ